MFVKHVLTNGSRERKSKGTFFELILMKRFHIYISDATTLNKSYQGLDLVTALDSIKNENNLKVFFKPEWFEGKKVAVSGNGLSDV